MVYIHVKLPFVKKIHKRGINLEKHKSKYKICAAKLIQSGYSSVNISL